MPSQTAISSTWRLPLSPCGGRGSAWLPQRGSVAIALPASHVITKKIIVAAGLREQELELQVESEANQYIPFALEEVNLDFQVLGPAPSSPDEIEVLIAASRKEKVEDRVAVVESAGLKPLWSWMSSPTRTCRL
jgi:type IV pilus assembly protein PilM